MNVKIYVEGGAKGNHLRTRCREGFSEFFRKAGLKGRMPRVVASGDRRSAYDSFETALRNAGNNDFVVLLVDSEDPIAEKSSVWDHLKQRDNWDKPNGVDDDHAHLMVQCMEAWFMADQTTLSDFFGQHFRSAALPKRGDVENIRKQDIYSALKRATRGTQKGEYGKGRHSFMILSQLDPAKVISASPHADRLIKILREKS